MPFASRTGRRSRWGASSASSQVGERYDVGAVNRQIDNARLRISDSGFNADTDSDKRNWFEKATNLPENQNWFFDTFDILGRPSQAGFNTIRAIQEGDRDRGKAAWEGFSGQKRTRGADIIRNAGVDNKVAQAVLGTGFEILADPLSLIPGATVAKGVSAASRGVGRGVSAGYRAAENAIPAFGRFSENQLRPAAESTKDALGYMFNRDYKLDETLDGTRDATVKNLAQQSENTRRYMQEESLKTVADAARTAGGIETGIDVGRVMESPLQQLDESGSVLPRPTREISSNPQIRQAADQLTRSNSLLRQFAQDNGISIPEMEGYMTHVWSAAERELRKRNGRTVNVDQGRFGTGNPNKKILNKRELTGSAEDVNERLGRELFDPNAYFANAIGQKRLIDYVQAVNFRRQVLSNPNFARKLNTGDVVTPTKNQEIIDVNNYKFLKENDDMLEGLGLADEIGGKYLVTKGVKNALDRFQRINTDEGTKAFIRAFDASQNAWKKLALFSPGYHIRNMFGAAFNNYVGGMSSPDLVKYTSQALREVNNALRGNESKLFNEYRRQGLGSSSLSNVEFMRSVDPEKAIEKTVRDRSASNQATMRLNPLRAFETSREAGDYIDQVNRFAIFKWAKDRGMSAEDAAKKVREVQFDYTNLSPFEQKITRLVPFYRWMRNNIPFQLQRFINDPRRYANINKIRLNAQDAAGVEEENTADFMKENFAFPVISTGEGQGRMLGLNLPVADLPKLSNPLKLGLDAISPFAKLPAELSLNRSFFYDRPISQFEGQNRQLEIPQNFLGMPVPGGGTDFPSGLEMGERAAYVLESLGGQPARSVLNTFTAPESEDQAKKFSDPVFGIDSLLKEYDVERDLYFKRREELQRLQDLMRWIEQQTGQEVRTVNEIR